MPDTIPISVDDRRFTMWEWLQFLFLFTFFTLHLIAFSGNLFAAIWEKVWGRDFSNTQLILAVGLTVIVSPALVAFYGLVFEGLATQPFVRGSVLLDTKAGRLILKRRHITGFCCQKWIFLADIRNINVTWNKDEEGEEFPQFMLIPTGKPVWPAITNPADATDLAAFTTRLRAELASAGWSDPSEPASAPPRQAIGSVV